MLLLEESNVQSREPLSRLAMVSNTPKSEPRMCNVMIIYSSPYLHRMLHNNLKRHLSTIMDVAIIRIEGIVVVVNNPTYHTPTIMHARSTMVSPPCSNHSTGAIAPHNLSLGLLGSTTPNSLLDYSHAYVSFMTSVDFKNVVSTMKLQPL